MDFAYCIGCGFLLLRATRLRATWTWASDFMLKKPMENHAEDPWSLSGATLPEEVDQQVVLGTRRPGIWRECCREGAHGRIYDRKCE